MYPFQYPCGYKYLFFSVHQLIVSRLVRFWVLKLFFPLPYLSLLTTAMKLLIVVSVILGLTLAKPNADDEMFVETDQDQVKLDNPNTAEDAAMEKDGSPLEEDAHWADEHNILNDFNDDEGMPSDVFQTFMVSEMAGIMIDSPIAMDDGTVEGRFLCKKCLKKYKVCKDICRGLVKLSTYVLDLIPCGTTCLQRMSACCFTGANFMDSNYRRQGNYHGHFAAYVPPGGPQFPGFGAGQRYGQNAGRVGSNLRGGNSQNPTTVTRTIIRYSESTLQSESSQTATAEITTEVTPSQTMEPSSQSTSLGSYV